MSLLSVVENTGLALLELKEKFKDDHKKHKIHPALLDNAVNIAIQSIGDGLYLPWTYKSICIYDDMPDKFYSFIKLNNKDFSNEFVKFDIQLIDENGKVFIETFDYTIKKVNTVEFGKAAEPIPELLSINWLKLEKISADNIKSQDEDIVFFHLENSHTALIEEFRVNGHNVFPIKLSSLEQKDFAEILGGLPDIDSIKFVFYLGDDYQEFAKIDGLKSVLDKTLFAFFHFARELIQGKRKISNIDIIFIGKEVYEITGEEKLLQPHYSSLIGLGKVINQEYPNIKCKSLDIDDNCRANDIYLEIMNNQQLYYIGIRQNQRYGMQRENKIQKYPEGM